MAVVGGGYLFIANRHIESTDNAYVRSDITPISPKVGGYVAELLVTDNQLVAAGQLLLRIEDEEYRHAVTEAEARVAEARAAIANVDARLARQQSMVTQAAADIDASDAESYRAGRQLGRERSLLEDEYGTQQRYDRAAADRATAEAAVTRTRAAHEETLMEITVMESERELLLARAEQMAAALELARIDLRDTEIVAPVDGIVGNRSIRQGELVQPGAYLMAIVPLQTVWIEANFKETQLTRMAVGQTVDITVDTYPDAAFSGRVESISPASGAEFSLIPPENASGNFTKLVQRIPVRIAVDGEGLARQSLRTGMSVTVRVDTGSAGEVAPTGVAAQILE